MTAEMPEGLRVYLEYMAASMDAIKQELGPLAPEMHFMLIAWDPNDLVRLLHCARSRTCPRWSRCSETLLELFRNAHDHTKVAVGVVEAFDKGGPVQ